MKTSELTGALLDYWVARAEGFKPWFTRLAPDAKAICTIGVRHDDDAVTAKFYCPSTDWARGGPLIEKYKLCVGESRGWYAGEIAFDEFYTGRATGEGNAPLQAICRATGEGNAPLQAICRAVVRAAFGDEVEEIPC